MEKIKSIYNNFASWCKNASSHFLTQMKGFLTHIKESILNVRNIKISSFSRKQRFISGFLVICLLVVLSNDFVALSQNMVERPCKVIKVDGVEAIKVPVESQFDVLDELNNLYRANENRDVNITSKIEVADGTGFGYEVSDQDEIISIIADKDIVNYEVLAVDLRLDDEHVAYVNSIEDVSEILDDVKKPYEGEQYSLVDFKEEVTFDETFVPKDEILTNDAVENILKGNKEETVLHTVTEGDTMWDLSIKNEITVDDLLYNNNLTEQSLLQLGDELVIKTAVPMISVRSYERVVYEAEEPFSTTEVKNDEEFVDYRKVVTDGVNGKKNVTADVVYTNGEETDRLIIEEVITVEPVTQVIEVGTQNTPPKKSIGTFIMPASGRISDRFGTRGGKHKGIDIANASGTPIVASDGGRVEFSGWQSGYGNLVIIDHQNGYKTYYGHNSANLVTVGQMVAQGELIAKMGTTGRSTGNHSHFEVRVNGTPQNPFDYVQY